MRGQVWLRLLNVDQVKAGNAGKYQVGPVHSPWTLSPLTTRADPLSPPHSGLTPHVPSHLG